MESLFGRYKNALVLMLVLLAQVVLLGMQVRRPAPDMPDGHNVRLWRYMVNSVIAPPERLAHSIGRGVRDTWTRYIYLRNLRQENESLQAENDRLRLQQASLAEDARAGQQLREMLDFRGKYIDTTVAAQVIGTSGTDQARVLLIDRGSKDGLEVQMPVITPDGIVGKIKNVFPHTAQVLLISDQTSGTGVLLANTRVRGVMKGNASGQPQIINISPDDRIQPGEPVMTSGGDQVYPPGMPVGTVEKVVADSDSAYVNVVIKPNANLAALEQVLIVTAFSDKMPFAQEKDLMQSEVVALAEKQRAADILSEKLPSLHEVDTASGSSGEHPVGVVEEDAVSASSGDPARPNRPPQPLHPDRYSPGASPSAESLTPAAAPPALHRSSPVLSGDQNASAGTKPATTAPSTTPSRQDSPLVSRFPPKPVPVAPAGGASGGATAAAGSTGGSSLGATTSSSSAAKLSTPSSATGTSTPKPSTATGLGTAASKPATTASSGTTTPKTTVPTTGTPVAKPSTGANSGAASGTAPATAGSTTGQTTAPVRKKSNLLVNDSDGILSPAGVSGADTGTTPATKPAPKPKAAAPTDQSAPPPATTPPGGV